MKIAEINALEPRRLMADVALDHRWSANGLLEIDTSGLLAFAPVDVMTSISVRNQTGGVMVEGRYGTGSINPYYSNSGDNQRDGGTINLGTGGAYTAAAIGRDGTVGVAVHQSGDDRVRVPVSLIGPRGARLFDLAIKVGARPVPRGVALSGGGVLVATSSRVGTIDVNDVYKLTADGAFDLTFGRNGRARLTDMPAVAGLTTLGLFADQQGRAVVLLERIAAGSTPGGAFVLRLDAAGRPDVTFGQGGVTHLPLDLRSSLAADRRHVLSIDDAGRILVHERNPTARGRTHVVRLSDDGTLDTSFADGGVLTLKTSKLMPALAVAPGTSTIYLVSDGVVLRFDDAGVQDTSFHVRDRGPDAQVGGGLIAVADQEQVYVAGTVRIGATIQEGIARFATALSQRFDGIVLTPRGTSGADKISVVDSGSKLIASVNGVEKSYSRTSIKLLEVDAYGGNDLLELSTGRNVAVFAGTGNDRVSTGPGADSIDGGSGNDVVFSRDGNDTIDAGDGADRVVVGDGRSAINGGGGDDTIEVGGGSNSVYADDGDDTISAAGGFNHLEGGLGDDVFTLLGGRYDVFGGAGNDLIRGGGGNDILRGEDGDDTLFGNGGTDRLIGGPGIDLLTGGSGIDSFVVERRAEALDVAAGESVVVA